jgi:DnaJ-class molecular chaperone
MVVLKTPSLYCRAIADAVFKLVGEAYDVISDETKRSQYDRACREEKHIAGYDRSSAHADGYRQQSTAWGGRARRGYA